VLANEALCFSPALPAKIDAAANLPLGVADKIFLRIDRPEDLPKDTRVVGSLTTRETGSYTLRAFGRPVVEGYFGGAFAIEQLCNALGNDMARRRRRR
jgi:monoamine oxidase